MEVEDSPKVTSQKTGTNTAINKRRAKRTVKKRYQTEDGFMTTETVIEEYTASEDENDENEKRNPASNTDKKLNKSESTIEKKLNKSDSNAKKAKVVAAAVPSSKTKQGSIMSFFNKK